MHFTRLSDDLTAEGESRPLPASHTVLESMTHRISLDRWSHEHRVEAAPKRTRGPGGKRRTGAARDRSQSAASRQTISQPFGAAVGEAGSKASCTKRSGSGTPRRARHD